MITEQNDSDPSFTMKRHSECFHRNRPVITACSFQRFPLNVQRFYLSLVSSRNRCFLRRLGNRNSFFFRSNIFPPFGLTYSMVSFIRSHDVDVGVIGNWMSLSHLDSSVFFSKLRISLIRGKTRFDHEN